MGEGLGVRVIPSLLAGLADELRAVAVAFLERRGSGDQTQRGGPTLQTPGQSHRGARADRLTAQPPAAIIVADDGDVGRGATGAHPAWLDAATIDVERRLLCLRGTAGTEIVRRLQALTPGGTVEVAQQPARRFGDVDVERLPHVDPLLSPCGTGD